MYNSEGLNKQISLFFLASDLKICFVRQNRSYFNLWPFITKSDSTDIELGASGYLNKLPTCAWKQTFEDVS